MRRRLLNLFIALDQLVYVILTLGNGQPDETLSAAAYRLEQKGHWAGKLFRPLIDFVVFIQDDHCYWAAKAEVSGEQSAKYTFEDTV